MLFQLRYLLMVAIAFCVAACSSGQVSELDGTFDLEGAVQLVMRPDGTVRTKDGIKGKYTIQGSRINITLGGELSLVGEVVSKDLVNIDGKDGQSTALKRVTSLLNEPIKFLEGEFLMEGGRAFVFDEDGTVAISVNGANGDGTYEIDDNRILIKVGDKLSMHGDVLSKDVLSMEGINGAIELKRTASPALANESAPLGRPSCSDSEVQNLVRNSMIQNVPKFWNYWGGSDQTNEKLRQTKFDLSQIVTRRRATPQNELALCSATFKRMSYEIVYNSDAQKAFKTKVFWEHLEERDGKTETQQKEEKIDAFVNSPAYLTASDRIKTEKWDVEYELGRTDAGEIYVEVRF